ncbi:helix-turn-helix transcriptional regulator [Nostoc sp. NIES-2111]
MAGSLRFYIARLQKELAPGAPLGTEHFVMLPESMPADQRIAEAHRRWEFASIWLLENSKEIDRLTLRLRDFAHTLAAVVGENHPSHGQLGIDVLQEILLRPTVREKLSRHIAFGLAASICPEEDSVMDLSSILQNWRQAVSARGRFSHHVNALLSLYHAAAARAVAEVLSLSGFDWPSLPGETVTEIPIPLEFFSDPPKYLHVMNNLPYHAVRELLSFGQFQRSDDSPWPTAALRKGSTSGHAQLFPVEMEIDPYRETQEQRDLAELMWMQVSELSDLDADVLDMLSAVWVQQARSPNDAAKVSVKDLLRMRGLRPKTGEGGRSSGFRPDQKQQLFRSLTHIQNLYLLIQDMELPGSERESPRGRESREVRSRAFIITDIAGKRTDNGPLDIEEFLIRPGVLFGYFLFGHGRQIALLSAKAVEYDRIRQDWEKRLARYFSWQWRNDALNQRSSRKFLVRTLLDNTGKTVDPLHPKRTRLRLEKALDVLTMDKVIEGWRWDSESPRFGDSQRWSEYWLSWSVEIKTPEYVRKHYRNLSVPGSPAALSGSSLYLPVTEDLPIAESLYRYRQQNRLSQMEMASKLGITQSYYSLLERGARKPNLDLGKAIRRLLHGPI